MSIDGGGDGGEMTLAFSVSAVERLDDPAAAFDDAGGWSRFVGVVDNNREAVERTVATHDLRQDYDLDDRDIWLVLEAIRESTRTPRHVYVGTTTKDRRVATELGWEFVRVGEAAEKAGWALSERSETGLFERVLVAVSDRLTR
jgi:hypothetical protein